jgi:hypothetical protein
MKWSLDGFRALLGVILHTELAQNRLNAGARTVNTLKRVSSTTHGYYRKIKPEA